MIEFAQRMDYIEEVVELLRNADAETLETCSQFIGEIAGMTDEQIQMQVEQLEEIDLDGLHKELTKNL